MTDLRPTEKVQAGGYSGAAAIVLLWLLDPHGTLPPIVSAAITLLIAGAGAWIKTEGTGWFRLLRVKRGKHER
jgi:hypothetical protein